MNFCGSEGQRNRHSDGHFTAAIQDRRRARVLLARHLIDIRARVFRTASPQKRSHRARVIDPHLTEYEMNGEADPKCDSEEFVGAELPCREESSNDGPDDGDRQPDGKRTDHPLAMKRNPPPANE